MQPVVAEVGFWAESGINLMLKTGGVSDSLTALVITAQCVNVGTCQYLEPLGTLDATYVLTNAADPGNAMDGRTLDIVHLLRSTEDLVLIS
jgi:hypothetical protein